MINNIITSRFGKPLSDEKGCIALTSWQARISFVGLTIFNLNKMCGKDFHIVLTLSSDEFPNRERDLPKSLIALCIAGLCEIIWIKPNLRSFKKWMFTGLLYPNVPIITADDDCIYGCNYADALYQFYKANWSRKQIYYCSPGEGSGWGYLFPPNVFGDIGITQVESVYKISQNDDLFYITIADKLKIPRMCINVKSIAYCHDTVCPINIGKEYADHPERREYEIDLFNKIIKV